MIEFHLDVRSGVSPYLQIVHQVRHALRLGMLREGDQLPTVKVVVSQLAINPNTVLKAYKELEHSGLVAARPGIGTFVTATLSGAPLIALGPLRQDLQRWLAKARRAGLDEESIEALFLDCLSRQRRRGRSVSAALRTAELGKRYGRRWALEGCTLEVPAGHVVGLVGPNGAGKTTLLQLAVGLLAPTSGTIEVLGGRPAENPGQLARVGFVAQDTPVYSSLSVADHLQLGAWLNPSWDRELADRRIDGLGLDRSQRAGKLSGGQRAQFALTLAIAKRPELLILDEPVASLDPLARREFLQGLMEVVADGDVSVILSSHLVADLERVCDYLIVLVASHVRLIGPIEELQARHFRLTGPRECVGSLPPGLRIVEASHTDRQSTLVVRGDEPPLDPAWSVEKLNLEDMVLAYMRQQKDAAATQSRLAEVPR